MLFRSRRVAAGEGGNAAFHLTSCANGFQDRVGLRKLAGGQFRIDLFAVDDHFKRAATRRDQGERFDRLFEPQQFLRQTDGMWLIISSRAIFDLHFYCHNHASLSGRRVGERSADGQGCRRGKLRTKKAINPDYPCNPRSPRNPWSTPHHALRDQRGEGGSHGFPASFSGAGASATNRKASSIRISPVFSPRQVRET